MPDHKSKISGPDRSRVASEQDNEVSHIAEKYGISTAEARKLIERFGNDREKLDVTAETLKHGFLPM
jgi:hypothetical protein